MPWSVYVAITKIDLLTCDMQLSRLYFYDAMIIMV